VESGRVVVGCSGSACMGMEIHCDWANVREDAIEDKDMQKTGRVESVSWGS